MFKILYSVVFLLLFFFLASPILAQSNNFVSVVNPVRGADFWSLKNQNPQEAVAGQMNILKEHSIDATWLIRFDALLDTKLIDSLKSISDEKGLFLEVVPSWAKEAEIKYHYSASWHEAGSALLTGYETSEREKLIESSFERFKSIFGYYPKSVGAWWIDSYSLNYMYTKYGIISALIVADQYTTDNYQIWGQYWSTPYYPTKNNTLHPAQTLENKLPVVITQWAARDPVNGYGNGVLESTYSVQANDYLDYHNLDSSYFEKLIDIYTKQKFNKFGHIVIGLENSYEWSKYQKEYENQIKKISQKQKLGDISVVSLRKFAEWYKQNFPDVSPSQIIVADDPLGKDKKVVWFMNPYYRVGWFYNEVGSVFRDIRQYIDGEQELCFQKRCEIVNFATSATRVLDEVSFGHRWIIDEGKLSDFKVLKEGEEYVLTYKNEASDNRRIEFLPRDIGVDGKISSIDTTILAAVKTDATDRKTQGYFKKGNFSWSSFETLSGLMKFLLFLIVVCLVPGFNLINKSFNSDNSENLFKRSFLALTCGIVLLTTSFYITSILNLRFLIYFYVLGNLFLFYKFKLISTIKLNFSKIQGLKALSILIIIVGTVFQVIPTIRSGLIFPYGMGFWGPNTHDGIWHISLINQLIKSVPPQNPIFADSVLKNYHFLYDLFIAATVYFTKISVIDLIFRFYPILFSLLLGLGTYCLVTNIFKSSKSFKAHMTVIFSLYFVYFAGSFGWIVEYLKQKSLGGESAFWANQSISFNLNPPFAISLIIIIAILQLLPFIKSKFSNLLLILIIGTLVGFKAYAAILILLTLAVVGVFKKSSSYILVFLVSLIVSIILVLSNFSTNKQLVIFSPFWFIHSMIDAPDRVGWTRLTLTRRVGLETKNWFKFISAELIGLTLFILGNLGMRVLSLFMLSKLGIVLKNTQLVFILIFSILSLLIPILFIQSGNPWNTIQFSYYGLYIASIASGLVLSTFLFKMPKLAAPLIVGVVILTPINSVTTATYYLGDLPHGQVDTKELEALKFLSNQEEGIVLTYPYDEKLKKMVAEPWPLFVYDSTSYVSAFSHKSVFLEDEGQNQILLTDYKKRLVSSKDFFLNKKQKFLIDNKIKYIYLPKILNIGIDESSLNVYNVFENSEVRIYKVKE